MVRIDVVLSGVLGGLARRVAGAPRNGQQIGHGHAERAGDGVEAIGGRGAAQLELANALPREADPLPESRAGPSLAKPEGPDVRASHLCR